MSDNDYPPDDDQYQEHMVQKVDGPSGDGDYVVHFDDGFCMTLCDESGEGAVPQAGSVMRVYGRGFGYRHRGVFIDGVEMATYRSDEDQRARVQQQADEADEKRRAEFEEEREGMDRRFDALPEPFRKRIQRRRDNNPDFRWKFEGYEMMCCEEAVKFAERARDAEKHQANRLEVAAFWSTDPKQRIESRLFAKPEEAKRPEDYAQAWFMWAASRDYGVQKELLDPDVAAVALVSFGVAVTLATLYLEGDAETIDRMYGAMAPLVGSEAYGDMSQEEIEERRRRDALESNTAKERA